MKLKRIYAGYYKGEYKTFKCSVMLMGGEKQEKNAWIYEIETNTGTIRSEDTFWFKDVCLKCLEEHIDELFKLKIRMNINLNPSFLD